MALSSPRVSTCPPIQGTNARAIRLRKRPCYTQPCITAGFFRRLLAAFGRTHDAGARNEGSAPEHAATVVYSQAEGVFGCFVAPLIGVAVHIKESKVVGLLFAHRMGMIVGILAVPAV